MHLAPSARVPLLVKNLGGRYGGAITAGMFLREFVDEKIPWAHIDIAGVSDTDSPKDMFVAGPTGFGVRLLTEVASSFARGG